MFRGSAVISNLASQTPIYAYTVRSFLISTVVMFTDSYCCVRVDFFIFGTMAWLFSTICKAFCNVFIFEAASLRGDATQPLMRDEEASELRRDPTVEQHARVQIAEPKNCVKAHKQDSQEKDD